MFWQATYQRAAQGLLGVVVAGALAQAAGLPCAVTARLRVVDERERPIHGVEVRIVAVMQFAPGRDEIFEGRTGPDGRVTLPLGRPGTRGVSFVVLSRKTGLGVGLDYWRPGG